MFQPAVYKVFNNFQLDETPSKLRLVLLPILWIRSDLKSCLAVFIFLLFPRASQDFLVFLEVPNL